MKIVIAGGSGQVGTILARAFVKHRHKVVVLSRKPEKAPWLVETWDGRTMGAWAQELDGADVVINLAGRNINCRYTKANRQKLVDSRVYSTRLIGEAINRAGNPPPLWLQASAANIYANRYVGANDEATGQMATPQTDSHETWQFAVDLTARWERALWEADVPKTRKIALRTTLVMNPDKGSVFDVLLGLTRHGLGGRQGDGKQFVSWIHYLDYVRVIKFLIDRKDIEGPVNMAAPNPLPNEEFMAALRKAWGAGFGLPAEKWMLEIGAFFLRTETELILKSRRVVSSKLADAGFKFEYPTWPEAAKDLTLRWREINKQPPKRQ